MSTVSYMHISVRGLIKALQSRRKNAKTHITDKVGQLLHRDEAIDALMDELSKGREVIPTLKTCGNPCAYASCKGFDYKGGGCGGHDSNDSPRGEI